MEVFSLLKFWRNAAGETIAGDFDVSNRAPETDDEDSFFDLVLTGPDCEFKGVVLENNSNISSTSVDIKSFDNDNDEQQLHHKNNTNKLSKRDGETKSGPYNSDSFSIRKILPIETNSKPQSPMSLLRSPPKFRVFMLGFKKSSSLEANSSNITRSVAASKREQSKRFSMRYRVEELTMATFLGRDNSLRSKMQRESSEDSSPANESVKKDIGVYKYLRMIKPLYVRASKIRIFDQSTTVTPLSSPATASVNSPRKQAEEKQGSRAVFREVYRTLMKSRWASSAVGSVPAQASRRDDSALQQQDGIQSAILHCKRSYSSSSSSSSSTISQECRMLSRSASDSSSIQRAFNPPRRSAEEEKRSRAYEALFPL